MSNRTLTWHLQRAHLGGSSVGPSYWLDRDYDPLYVWAVAKKAPGAQPVNLDLLMDGASIFRTTGSVLQIPVASTSTRENDFVGTKLREGSILTLSVLQSDGQVGDITVGLELE